MTESGQVDPTAAKLAKPTSIRSNVFQDSRGQLAAPRTASVASVNSVSDAVTRKDEDMHARSLQLRHVGYKGRPQQRQRISRGHMIVFFKDRFQFGVRFGS